MSPSLIVTLLAQRPTTELESARDKMRADIERLRVELEQVEEALARQSRRAPRSPGATERAPLRRRIIDVLAASGEAMTPAQVLHGLAADGGSASRGSVHTTLGRMVERGQVARVGEGLYALSSRNGAASDANPGPAENEASEPLSLATLPQEGA